MPKIDKDWNPGRHTQFSSTNQPKNRGRKPKLKNIQDNAREKVMEALFHALTLPDQRTAMEYLKKEAKDLPEWELSPKEKDIIRRLSRHGESTKP